MSNSFNVSISELDVSVRLFLLGIVVVNCCAGCGGPTQKAPKTSPDAVSHHTGNGDQIAAKPDATPKKVEEYWNARTEYDKNVWALERDAQRFERYFVALWDRLRAASNQLDELSKADFQSLSFPQAIGAKPLDHNILSFQFGDQATDEIAVDALARHFPSRQIVTLNVDPAGRCR